MGRAYNRPSALPRLAPMAAFALLALAAGAGRAAAPPPPLLALPPAAGVRLPPGELAHLAGGEVLVQLERGPASGPGQGLGVGVIDGPPARVFAALADFAHWSEFMPFMRRSDARREPDGSFLCNQSLALPGGERHYQARAVARAEGSGGAAAWRIAWSYVPGSGNIAAQRGSWTLVPYGGRTLAVLRLDSDPGGISAWLTGRATAKSIPWIFNGLRQHVGRDRYAAAAAPG
jgi:hypothetical protein